MAGAKGKRSRTERERLLLLEPSTLDSICESVANRGSLGTWCAQKDVRFSSVHGWLHADRERLAQYARALEAAKARMEAKVTDRIEALLDADPRKAAGRGGKILALNKLPDSVAAAMTEVSQSPRGEVKLKMVPPDRAVELAGRSLGMFRDKVEVSGDIGISTRLAAARKRASAGK